MQINFSFPKLLIGLAALPLTTSQAFSFSFLKDIFGFSSQPSMPNEVITMPSLSHREICLLPPNPFLTGRALSTLNICYPQKDAQAKFCEFVGASHFDHALNVLQESSQQFNNSVLKWAAQQPYAFELQDHIHRNYELDWGQAYRDFWRAQNDDCFTNRYQFIGFIYDNDFSQALRFLRQDPIPVETSTIEWAHQMAAKEGHLPFVQEINWRNLLEVNAENYQFALKNAAENGHLAILQVLVQKTKNLELQILRPMLSEVLKKAALAGKLESVRYLCESSLLNLDDKIALVQQGAASAHFSVLKYMLNQVPSHYADQALIHAASHANKEAIFYYLKEYSFSQNIKDQAITKAMHAYYPLPQDKREIVLELKDAGASIFADQRVTDYLVALQEAPSIYQGDWLGTLQSEHKRMLLEAHLKHSPLNETLFKVIVAQNSYLTDMDLYILLGEMIAHHIFDEGMLEPFLDRLEKFSEDQNFRLARLALIKNDPLTLYLKIFVKIEKHLSITSLQRLGEIQAKQIEKNSKKAQLKQQILKNFNANKVKNKAEEEARIKKLVQPHAQKLIELYRYHSYHGGVKKDEEVNYSSGGQTTVIELQALPGIIFKFVTEEKQDAIAAKHQRTNIALKTCEEHHLHHLRIPNNVFITELDGQPVKILAEERLDILLTSEYHKRLRMMNEDPELLPIANTFLQQLTLFGLKTGLNDICATNIGLLADGSGLGIIDLDGLNQSAEAGIYSGGRQRNLIAEVYQPNFQALRDAVLAEDAPIDFQWYESIHQGYSNMINKQKQLWAKHGVADATDPIDFDDYLLAELSPQDKIRALSMIKAFNKKLIHSGELRTINYKDIDLVCSGWQEEGRGIVSYEKHLEIREFLIHKGIVAGIEDLGGYGIAVYC